jgi:hypothetical protein
MTIGHTGWIVIRICPQYRYSVLSIYRPRNIRFSIFTVRHLSCRISSISLTLFISASTISWTAIFPHGSFERKNWSEIFMWDPCCTPAPLVADCMYVCVLHCLSFPRDLQFQTLIFALVFSSLAMAQKLVTTVHNRLKIIESKKTKKNKIWCQASLRLTKL